MKYNTILECTLHDARYNDTFKTFILTYKGCNNCFEIDLGSHFLFNCDYEIIDKKEIFKVDDIQDLEYFLNKHNLLRYYNESVKKNNKLYVGGGNDYVLDEHLNVLGWVEEIEEV